MSVKLCVGQRIQGSLVSPALGLLVCLHLPLLRWPLSILSVLPWREEQPRYSLHCHPCSSGTQHLLNIRELHGVMFMTWSVPPPRF